MHEIRYAIYARKSTDEKERQIKSIPDQLSYCRDLAQRENLNVVREYQESASAKTAGNRPVFDEMIHALEKGEINGIISWHPDRLSRNGREGGIIIDLLDTGKLLDLSFCTFWFENTPQGKFMLQIAFGQSKYYVDNLSENIKRGIDTNLVQGKSVGTYKWGYLRNKEGLYEPHPEFYGYIKHVWKMRLEGKTYEEILKWIKIVDCKRETKKGNIFKIGPNTLTQIFNDPLYYGVLRQKGEMIDLRKLYDFKPMVNYEEFLQCGKKGRAAVKLKSKNTYPFRDRFVHCMCGRPCVPDRGKNYLYLVCMGRKSCSLGAPRMRTKTVVDAVSEFLQQNFNPTEEQRQQLREAYAEYVKGNIQESFDDMKEQRRQLTKTKNETEERLNELVISAIGKTLDETERRIYEQQKVRYEELITQCTEEIQKFERAVAHRNFDYDEFSNFLEMASVRWKRAKGEPLHQMAKFLFSNITVFAGTVHNFQLNSEIEDLFIPEILDGGASEIRTRDLLHAMQAL